MSYNKYKYKFRVRSSTDINNYNNFLLDLDNVIQNTTINTNIDLFVATKNLNKCNVKQVIKTIDNECVDKKYDHKCFTGITYLEQLSTSNELTNTPNVYNSNKNIVDEHNHTKVSLPIIKRKVIINEDSQLNNISDLLDLIKKYPYDADIEYNINMDLLHKIKEPLTDLNNMIGIKNVKENIIDQILFYIQNLHTINSIKQGNDFMHTVIYGPPGTGKTEIAKMIGSIFSKMGILSKGTFKKVTRSDLIAGYLGQTALKTKDVIKASLGGVLFIDEAYALGNEDKRDSFSKECIDTLCESLSDHKDNLMVIIAGYETDLRTCFFNYNQGLESRFTWRFKTDEYSAKDLYNIFIKKINDSGWSIADNSSITVKWFETNKSSFKSYGRDIETLFAKTKIAHSRRVFYLEESVKKKLILNDINKGFEIFLKNEDSQQKEKDKFNNILSSMYI
jgi:ATP-dependent 26S proteasome regulatory subunit